MMLSITELTATLDHWLSQGTPNIAIEVDKRPIDLTQMDRGVTMRIPFPLTLSQCPHPGMLVMLTGMGAERFSALPSLDCHGQYHLVDFIAMDKKSPSVEPLMARIEQIVNQVTCWQACLKTQFPDLDETPKQRPNQVPFVPLSLSQQLRPF
ncbi:hypothetical protein [Vibrio tritonius]|uniref:hypothetical protein n=1 Tax=Vibrio tritonius TaxID=1435069 RepID=UPI00315D93C6